MQDRLSRNDVTNRVNVEEPARVRDAVIALYAARYPGLDTAPLERAFADFATLFAGHYPGFLACDTLYHDMRHTLDMTLALARLVDGHDRACAAGDRLGPRRAVLGVLIALLHDAGYLRRSADTMAVDHWRRQQRHTALFEPLPPEAAAVSDGTASLEGQLLASERDRRLRQAIEDLPSRSREVLLLHKYEGLSYVEIGLRLGIARNTVMVHLANAMRSLRAALRNSD